MDETRDILFLHICKREDKLAYTAKPSLEAKSNDSLKLF
jgi:hypothetical protein